MKRLINYLESSPKNLRGLRILQIGIALVTILRVSNELRFGSFLYELTSFREGMRGFNPVFEQIGHWLSPISMSTQILTFQIIWLVGGILLLANRQVRLSLALICLGNFLDHNLSIIRDGGDQFVTLLSFYMLFTVPPKFDTKSVPPDTRPLAKVIGRALH